VFRLSTKSRSDLGGLVRSDARRNRERVLAAAEEVLAAEGLSASMRTIAERAGVGLGTIYRHFPTQQALYREIVLDWRRRLLADAADLQSTSDPGAAFFAFATRLVERTTQMKALVLAISEADGAREAWNPAASDDERLRGDTRAALQALLTRAQRAGAVRADLRLAELQALLNAACLAAVHTGWTDELRDRALAVMFDGFRPRPMNP
jgi:AcrR family transcriptional regulator